MNAAPLRMLAAGRLGRWSEPAPAAPRLIDPAVHPSWLQGPKPRPWQPIAVPAPRSAERRFTAGELAAVVAIVGVIGFIVGVWVERPIAARVERVAESRAGLASESGAAFPRLANGER